MDNRTISEEYSRIGQELIDTEPALSYIANSSATIMYLESEHKKTRDGQKIYAQCEKVPDKYRWGIPCDFTITVFTPCVEGFTDEQKRILIFHELLHVGVDTDDEGGEKYRTIPHDLEDFKLIIDRFGVDWDATDEQA